jgi:tetratricopeptide (TPR) repeat protein
MRRLGMLLAILMAAGLTTISWAGADDKVELPAAALFQQAGSLVEQAKFDEALKVYAAAARADPQNQAYRQQYSLLRQVLKLREYYPLVTDADTSTEIAAALRAFYYDNKAYSAALELDEQRHAELDTAESAAMLAETRLALNMNREAIAVLSELDENRQTMRTKVLHVIAMVREGMADKAQSLAGAIGKPEQDDPGLYFELACMRSLLGDTAVASEMLTKCFETTLPSQLEKARLKASNCVDLKPLTAAGEMTRLLAVESKVSESSCSSGASCASCPVRGNCGSTGSTATTGGEESDKK